MAHYAFIDDENVVVEVITGRHEYETVAGIVPDWEAYYGNLRNMRCVRTSYNGNIRKQYAGIGYTYDADSDVFIAPQPFPSWTLDESHDWQPPTPRPDHPATWDEDAQEWVEVNPLDA